jgi:hypothetical protein
MSMSLTNVRVEAGTLYRIDALVSIAAWPSFAGVTVWNATQKPHDSHCNVLDAELEPVMTGLGGATG